MLFNSLEYLVFFPIVFLLYYLLPIKTRWVMLLIASYIFYGSWNPWFLFLIMGSTLTDYFCGIKLDSTNEKKAKKKWLIVSLVINLGLLGFFKYFNFFFDNYNALLNQFGFQPVSKWVEVILPIGISFYTFQTLSYTIDVYRGNKEVERHLGKFALYVCFFPQLVAGPIERSTKLLPQFSKKIRFSYKRTIIGIQLIVWGLFKKVVVADRLSAIVDSVYQDPTIHKGPALILATVFFAFQIFCDFSAYSDIAIGSSKILGIDLMENFRRPYHAKSLSEFWSRWHISLSTWFRDYLYIPLGGNRTSQIKWIRNIFIVFLISGLWHGANWTFILWGAIHGFGFLIEKFLGPMFHKVSHVLELDKIPKIKEGILVFLTFTLVCFAWIFFRANSLSDAYFIATHIHEGVFVFLIYFLNELSNLNLKPVIELLIQVKTTSFEFVLCIMGIVIVEFYHYLQRIEKLRVQVQGFPTWFRWSGTITLIILILFYGQYDSKEFIYFQF